MYLYAKKLNNSAAFYIELGQHDQAISRLEKALHLINQSSSSSISDNNHNVTLKCTTEQVCCCCNYCSLDECMVYSEENASYIESSEHKEEADDNRCEDYIHRRPIRFAPRFLFDEGHDMGRFLPLPITFNLALAHHLKCVSMFTVSTITSDTATTRTTKNSTTAMRKVAHQKVLRLYRQTYALQTELISQESILCTRRSKGITDPGLRFNIIICNNLSQVHKISQNHEKQKQCLQQLLSMLMYVVDMEHESYRSSSRNSSSSSNNIIHEQEYPQVSSSASLATTMAAATLPSSRRGRKWLLMDLDGFLQNTSPIILLDTCAMAA